MVADLALSDGCDAGAEIHHAIPHEYIGRGFLVHGREHTEVRHHEDAVDRKQREPDGLIGIHHHQHRLGPPRGVRKDAAAADN